MAEFPLIINKSNLSFEGILIHDSQGKKINWQDTSYHFGLEKNSNRYVYCIGLSTDYPGPNKANFFAIELCLVGDYNKDYPTKIQYFLLASLCRYLMKIYDFKDKDILLCREIFPKNQCPGLKFSKERLLNAIKGQKDEIDTVK